MNSNWDIIMDPDNIERYDRQIRLWGQHGQNKCSSAKICLINANSLGTEILKGLCLAGIGSFTILDSHKLAPEDVGCNFIPQSCVGKNRAESAKSMLLDLNDEVSGEVYPLELYLPHLTPKLEPNCDTSIDLKQDIEFWRQFNCVIASGFLYTDQIFRLSKVCWNTNIPLILCRSIGFYGSFRSQIKEHLITEAHPDNTLPMFNVDRPFDSLKDYLDSIDLEDVQQIEKVGGYPYIVIVYKYLKMWQAQNGFSDHKLPTSYSEKRMLKTVIDEGLNRVSIKKRSLKQDTTTVGNTDIPFENFIEASKAVNSCLIPSDRVPESLESIFNDIRVKDISRQNSSRFWLIIKAIKDFVHMNQGMLPVLGTIPDMVSSSEEYLRLQSIYAKKAREDLDQVFGLVQTLINSSNYSPGSSLYDETKYICKNIRDLKLIYTSPIHEEYSFEACSMREDDEENEFVTIGLCLKALDLFFSTYGRLPGCQDDQVETDISKLKDCVKQIIGKTSNRLKTLDQCLYEICRYGGAELHATSAFMGGCVAQEVIKLITNQYVPVDNTLVYNAMAAEVKSFRFSDTFLMA